MVSITIAAVIMYLTYEAVKHRNKQIEELNEQEVIDIKNEIASQNREGFKVDIRYTDEQLKSLSNVVYNEAKISKVHEKKPFDMRKLEKLDKEMEDIKRYYKQSVNKATKSVKSDKSTSLSK